MVKSKTKRKRKARDSIEEVKIAEEAHEIGGYGEEMPSRDDIQPSYEGEPSLEYTHGPVSKSISKSTGKFRHRLQKENPEQH